MTTSSVAVWTNRRFVFLFRIRLLTILGLGFCLCASDFSFPQRPDTKEMDATIRTYWPRAQYTLRTESNLVEVEVVVRNGQGMAIGGLSKEEFEIVDAGKKQEITTFSVKTFTPITSVVSRPAAPKNVYVAPEPIKSQLRFVALVFDDYSLRYTDQVSVKAAARRFLKEGLAMGDRVGLFTTSGKQIVPFTDDVAKLVAAIDRYSSFPTIPFGGECPKLMPYDAYLIANKIDYESLSIKAAELARCSRAGTQNRIILPGQSGDWGHIRLGSTEMQVLKQAQAIWDQICDTSLRSLETTERLVDYMAELPGRRMVLLASSGFLAQTLEWEQENVIRHALRSEVVINSLDAKGLYAEDPPEVTRGVDERSIRRMVSLGTKEKDYGNEIMATLAMGTGGLFFRDNNDLDLGFRKLGMVPEFTYLLGFTPDEPPNGKYHGLRIRMKSRNDYLIQTRKGYWAVTKQQQGSLAQERRVDHEVMGSDTLKELAAVISSEPCKTDAGDPALEVVLNIDARHFHFVEKGGLRTQGLVFIATLFDTKGSFVTGTELDVKFALKEPTFIRMTQTGLEMSVTLQAPPGAYRLRGVVQDGIDGKILTSTLPVQIQ